MIIDGSTSLEIGQRKEPERRLSGSYSHPYQVRIVGLLDRELLRLVVEPPLCHRHGLATGDAGHVYMGLKRGLFGVGAGPNRINSHNKRSRDATQSAVGQQSVLGRIANAMRTPVTFYEFSPQALITNRRELTANALLLIS